MKKLDEILAGKKSVGLAGHVRPDGDCVGSTLGVYNYIRIIFPDIVVNSECGAHTRSLQLYPEILSGCGCAIVS